MYESKHRGGWLLLRINYYILLNYLRVIAFLRFYLSVPPAFKCKTPFASKHEKAISGI